MDATGPMPGASCLRHLRVPFFWAFSAGLRYHPCMKFNYQTPYTSTRLPVFARNVVSTSHPLAAQAGLRILWQGGNAVDAAIAAAAALTITEPVSNGLGSDAFCILWDGQQLHGLNASGSAPRPGRRATFNPSTVLRPPRHPSAAWIRSPSPARCQPGSL